MTDLIIENSPIELVVDNNPIELVVENSPIELLQNGVYNFTTTTIEQNRELLTIGSNNQTVFQLTGIPASPSKANVFLNGVKQTYANDFIINNVILTWLSIVNLSVSDILEIYYL